MEQNLLQAWALERVCDALLSLEVASSLVKHVMPTTGISPFFGRFPSCISSRITYLIAAVKHDANLQKKEEMP